MMRRSLGAVLWSLVGLISCFLGALSALLGTGAGRVLLARSLSGTLQRAVDGRVEVGDIGGTLFTGVTLRDVRLFDHDSTLVAFLPRAEVSYNPFDFAAGRVVLQDVRLDRPQFNLVQHANGRLNLEELLRLGEKDSAGPTGPPPLILLRDVEIRDGSLVLRLQDVATAADSVLEIDELGDDGRRRVRRFDNLNLRLSALRISAPRARGIRADIDGLSVNISDPAVTLRGAAGNLTVIGDSMELDLERVVLPGSQLAITGRVTWPRGPILYDLDIVADSASLADFAWIDPRFPADAQLRGALTVRSSPPLGAVLTVKLDPVQIRHHGGVVTGKVTAVALAGTGLVRLRDGDLDADNADLELARPFLDTLPFAGRLTGHTLVTGPMDSLTLDVDWVYRDSLVEGWPETRLVGSGIVDLRDLEGIAFRPFTLTNASVALGTARRLVPALELRGTIDGVGTVEGPYTNATYTGLLRHHDGDGPTSQLRGRLRLDARHDTLGVSADLMADTLALGGLRSSYPLLRTDVKLSGPMQFEGTIADLETHADLQQLGSPGRVRFDGRLVVLFPPIGARGFKLLADNVDLRSWFGRSAPTTRLNLAMSGDYVADTLAPPVGALHASVSRSVIAGSAVDSAAAAVRFADGRMLVDTFMLRLDALRAKGEGELGWRAPASGRLTVEVDADSLNALDSLLAWLAPRAAVADPDSVQALQGAATVRATLAGALDSLAVDARAEVRGLLWRAWSIPAAKGEGRWESMSGLFDVRATADSIARGDLGFAAAEARLAGHPDSLSWFGRSRIGDWLAVLGGGEIRRDSAATTTRLDSAAVLLPGEIWRLVRPALVEVTPMGIAFSDSGIDLQRAGEEVGTLALTGVIPLDGPGDAALKVRALPLAAFLALAVNDTTGARARVDADMTLRGTRRDPEIEGSFLVTGGTTPESPPLLGRGSLTYRARRLDAVLKGYRGARLIIDATAHLPLDLGLVDVARRQLPDTLAVRVVADSIDLSQLGLLEAFTSGVHGRFSADFGVRGRWEAPSLTGHAALHRAGASILSLNVDYEDITGHFSFAGDTIRVDSLGLRSGPGTLNVTGYVEMEQLTHPLLALELVAQEFRALEIRNFMSVTASGTLSMRGPLIGATVTGRGTVTSGILYFADLVNKRVVNLDEPWVATLIDPDELRKQQLEVGLHNRILDSLRVRNLNLEMGNDVWLRSNESNIQLSGTINLSKQARNYLMSGSLAAPRGTYRLIAGPVTREFVVTQGTVRYFGTPDLNAELDIQARHEVHRVPTATGAADDRGDFTVMAHIGGTLLVPHLTLSVEGQALSQTEIISYLMFGRSSFELAGEGGQRSALLQSALQSVTSAVSGELERTLVSDLGVPLDYVEIDVRPGDKGTGVAFQSALLAAGWQIGERTFLTLNAGFCTGKTVAFANTVGATLQFRISREWRTEASFEPVRTCGSGLPDAPSNVRRQLGLDLFWERRY